MAVRTTWRISAFQRIRRLPGVNQALQREVDRILDRVGRSHYRGGVERGRTRSRGYVVTADFQAMIDEAREKRLLRAAHGGDDA